MFDSNLDKITGGLIGGGLGRLMVHPTLAVDGSTWAVAYQDAQAGNVKFSDWSRCRDDRANTS